MLKVRTQILTGYDTVTNSNFKMLQQQNLICNYICIRSCYKERVSDSSGCFAQNGKAEITPVEPGQGNACAGKVDFNVHTYTSLSQHFLQSIFISPANTLKIRVPRRETI